MIGGDGKAQRLDFSHKKVHSIVLEWTFEDQIICWNPVGLQLLIRQLLPPRMRHRRLRLQRSVRCLRSE